MDISFILPHFDHADVVWDNCTEKLSNMFESLHLEEIRIISGAARGTSPPKAMVKNLVFVL